MSQRLWLELSGEWERVHEELLLYAAVNGWTTRQDKGGFVEDLTLGLWNKLPQTRAWLAERGWTADRLFWIMIRPNSSEEIHIDSMTAMARINFPVINCQHSRTTFHQQGEITATKTRTNGVQYYHLKENTREITSVRLTSPTVLTVSEPHRVVLDPDFTTGIRVAASISVVPDPIWLLKSVHEEHDTA